ncbi:MAG: CDP-alcohol phosphatidyltransferase family protein [Dehalococcoidales bacterium]|nr:CDP-alcohol phosphatidyltransferase family protein [Dehalococcoidales bacterium]
MIKWSQSRKTVADYFTRPVVRLLAKTPITPNIISWLGFLVAVAASALIITGHLFAAGFVVLLAGFFDILDGALARSTNRNTQFGAILDSSLDRLSEAIVLLAILIFYLLNANERPVIVALLVTLTIIGSFMVSYVRARAEALGLKGETGLFSRAERVIVLALGLLLSQIDYALITALALIMVFSFITVSQRLLYVWRQTKN